jgi:hypothetical protein
VIETVEEENLHGDDVKSCHSEELELEQSKDLNAAVELEIADGSPKTVNEQLHELVADANEQWTKMLTSAKALVPNEEKVKETEDEPPKPNSFAELDMDAFLRRVKANPQLRLKHLLHQSTSGKTS